MRVYEKQNRIDLSLSSSLDRVVSYGSVLFELCKIRMVMMVWITIGFGYFLAAGFSWLDPAKLLITMLGAGMAAAGSFYHNQLIEINIDGQMPRTMNRPLPTGRISAQQVFWLGLLLEIVGLALLYVYVGPLPCLLTALVAVSYVLVYTPLKQVSWLNTAVGAIPGAIPPMIGWTAVNNELGVVPWVLFAVMFIWQHPHFYAIGWLYREDYQRGGIKVLPALEETGLWSGIQSAAFALILIPVSLSLYWFGEVGEVFFYGAIVIGLGYFLQSLWFALHRTAMSARYLLFGSLIYLPVFLLLLSLDSGL